MEMNSQRLTLRERPTGWWFIGIIATALTLFIAYAEKSLAIALIGIAIGLLSFLLPSVLTITADKSTGLLTLTYRSPWRQSVKEIPLDEILAVIVERLESSDEEGRRYTYRVAIVLRNGERVPLHSYYDSNRGRHEETARRLRDFLGVGDEGAIVDSAAAQMSISQQGVTEGVRWEMQTTQSNSTIIVPIIRWQSDDFVLEEGFLYLAQKKTGQQTSIGGLLGRLNKPLFKKSLNVYGFDELDAPGMDDAEVLAPLPPRLEPYFMAFTTDPTRARQILNPWTVNPLAEWAERHPIGKSPGGPSQLVILFGPNGVSVAAMGPIPPDLPDELIVLGVELVRAQGGGGEH
ncbi:MAG: hypothetical protein D6770_08910 [Anaerolineae bacterium]|nr:MAG: hypothetical protein D6770_08910 [Anaerolineae bacterium]